MTSALLDRRARAAIERCAVDRRLLETGGSLFGWTTESGVIIACASGPGKGAKHRPRSFEPAARAVQASVDRVADSSDGRYSYVGSWHTHPCGDAVPSPIDLGTARSMSQQADLKLRRPLFLIVATTGSSRRVELREIRAWIWSPEDQTMLETTLRPAHVAERLCPCESELFISQPGD